jgi:hypothetical protein
MTPRNLLPFGALPCRAADPEPVRLTKDGDFKQHLHWSPDGKKLLFTRIYPIAVREPTAIGAYAIDRQFPGKRSMVLLEGFPCPGWPHPGGGCDVASWALSVCASEEPQTFGHRCPKVALHRQGSTWRSLAGNLSR